MTDSPWYGPGPPAPSTGAGGAGCDCAAHPGRPASARCVGCGRTLCGECRRQVGIRNYCPQCASPYLHPGASSGAPAPGIQYSYPVAPRPAVPPGLPPYGQPPPGYYPPGQYPYPYPPAPRLLRQRPIVYPGATWGVGEVVIVFIISFIAASGIGAGLYFVLKNRYPNDPVTATILLIFLSSVALYTFLLCGTFISVRIRHGGDLATVGVKVEGVGGGLLYGLGLGLPIILVALGVAYLFQHLFSPDADYLSRSVSELSSGYSVGLIVLLVITLVILAPICEEVFFRGYLYPALRNRMDRRPAMLINGLLFAAAHFEWLGFLPRFLLGYGMCYIYERQGNLAGPVTGHALYNGIILLLGLLSF